MSTKPNYAPVFSVVMPMYNVEKYVKEAIYSVLNQSYDNFELLLVDDGCTDKTIEKVKSFEDVRIKLITQRNRGLAGARNTGIHHAKGQYIALLDSDDIWHRDKLLEHLKHFNENPDVSVSYSSSEFVDESSLPLGIGQYPKLTDISPKDIFCRNPIGNGSAPVFKRQVFDKVGRNQILEGEVRRTFFDERLRQSEDIELWLRIALSTSFKFAGIEKALTYYRVNSSGLSANLEAQLESWKRVVKHNYSLNPDFFNRWYSLALAYQLRYLARRAVQSHNGSAAIRYINGAMNSSVQIIFEEPKRTLMTYGCALLSFLPSSLYAPAVKLGVYICSKSRKEKEEHAYRYF